MRYNRSFPKHASVYCHHCGDYHSDACPSPEEIAVLTTQLRAEIAAGKRRAHDDLPAKVDSGPGIREVSFCVEDVEE